MLVRVGVPTRAPSPAFAVAMSLALALSMSACSKKTAPETTGPAGFSVVRDAGAGFAVAVPGDWQRIPLPGDLDDFDKQSRALVNRNPKLSPAILQARQLLQFGGKLMAVSPDGTSIINLTVDKADEKTLAEIGQVTSAKLQEAGATNLAQEQATTGAGPALKLRFRLPIEGVGGVTQDANEIQYYVLRDGKSFVLTFQNAPDDVVDSVAGSLRLR